MLGWAPAARAGDEDPEFGLGTWVELAVAGVAVDATLGVSGLIFAIGNLSYVPRRYRASPLAWRVGGYTTAGLNLALGLGWLGFTLHTEDPVLLWGTVPHLVVGAVGMVGTVLGGREPPPTGTRVDVVPMVFADSGGRPAFGAQLSVVGW